MINQMSDKSILILTQKVDATDPVLGFFHGWVENLAVHYQRITVICLELGVNQLPKNVQVLSLGKEEKKSKLQYLVRFYQFIWRERKNYSLAFVLMNQEYVLLGGWLWKILGKKIYLWRNHKTGSFLTDAAVYLSDRVFYTSSYSYTAQFKKAILMPVGINTDVFSLVPSTPKIPRSILALGRISPVKRLDILIEALVELQRRDVQFTAKIIGSPTNRKEDVQYYEKLNQLAKPLLTTGQLILVSAVAPQAAPHLYRQHELYVNLTPAGSMDKTIFEAMACGSLVLVRNEENVTDMAGQLSAILAMTEEEKENQRRANYQLVEKTHSLELLISRLVEVFG